MTSTSIYSGEDGRWQFSLHFPSLISSVFPSDSSFPSHSSALSFLLFFPKIKCRYTSNCSVENFTKNKENCREQTASAHNTIKNRKIKKHEISQPAQFCVPPLYRSFMHIHFFLIHFCGSIMFDSISQFPYQIMYLNWIGETKFGAQEKETTRIAEISSGSSGTTIDMGEEERVNFRDSITRNENENISRERKANGSGEGENMENWWGFPLSSLFCSGVGGDMGGKNDDVE